MPNLVSVKTPACTSVPISFCAHTPEPLAAIPVPLLPATAADPEMTSASITCLASARRSRLPPKVISESIATALMVAVAASPNTPKPSLPIRLRATEMPIEAPTPLLLPAPTATDSETIVAAIALSLSAWISKSPFLAVA